MAKSAPSSSAAGRSEKDGKPAADSKPPDQPRRAPGKQPMSKIGQTETGDDQLKGKELTGGRGRGGRGGGRGSGENRGGDGHSSRRQTVTQDQS